jgi:hypothetical protein
MSSTVLEWSHILKLPLFKDDRGEWSASHPGRFPPVERTHSIYYLGMGLPPPPPAPVPVWRRWKRSSRTPVGNRTTINLSFSTQPSHTAAWAVTSWPISIHCLLRQKRWLWLCRRKRRRASGGRVDKEFVCSKWRITYLSTPESVIALRFMQQWRQWHQSGMYVVTYDPLMFDCCAGFRLLNIGY